MNSNKVIAIDGYASTGKSTLAKMLSIHYNLTFIDSGALYRAVTHFALEAGFLKDNYFDQVALESALKNLTLKFESDKRFLFLNGENISNKIRLPRVSDHVSRIAALPIVRKFLLHQQRQMVNEHGLVMDGRDIGTAVFPEADFKFFFTAKLKVRAQRRWKEMEANGYLLTYNEVLKNILDRDKIDTERKISPLKKANDAIEIDSTDLSLQQVFELCITKINGK